MYGSERIQLEDSAFTSVIKLAEGNPGAVSALTVLMEKASQIDPDSAWGPLGPLMSLDTLGIYGPRIWKLYKYVCDQDPVKVETLFRAHQLGFVSDTRINNAIDASRPYQAEVFQFDKLIEQIRETCPRFAKEVA